MSRFEERKRYDATHFVELRAGKLGDQAEVEADVRRTWAKDEK